MWQPHLRPMSLALRSYRLPREHAVGAWTSFWLPAIAFSGLTVALRSRMFDTPLTVDEGGYGYVARLWARGIPLYEEAWVDRPQGLLLMYRGAFAVFGDSALTIRGLAAAVAAITVLVIAEIGRRFTESNRGGLIAAALFSLLSAFPQIEGHTANGELLCALPSSVAVLSLMVALDSTSRRARSFAMFATGGFGAAAVLVKQSAYDVVLVGIVVICIAAWRNRQTDRQSFGIDALAFSLGGVALLAPAVAHGVTLGFSDWWFAVAGYRLGVENVMSGSAAERWTKLVRSAHVIGVHAAALVGFATLGLLALHRGRTRRMIPLLWFVCALTAFALGGLFHAHYYVGLVAPISVLGAQGVSELLHEHRLGRFRIAKVVAVPLCVVLVLPSVWSTWTVLREPSANTRSLLSSRDPRLVRNAALAEWLSVHSSANEEIYVIYADASLYYEADRRSAFKFLWERGVERIPGALDDLAAILDGDSPPAFLIQMSPPERLAGGEQIKEVVDRRYEDVIVIDGVLIRQLRQDVRLTPESPQ